MQNDILTARDSFGAKLIRPSNLVDILMARGVFTARCFRGGKLVWEDEFQNTVVTVGKNLILDSALSGTAYTATEYMGLINLTGFTGISAADTMTSHAGWVEWTALTTPNTRAATAWAAASAGAKALSSQPAFTMSANGTVKGAFLVGGTGASNVISNTGGTLISAGLFTGGDRPVLTNDIVNVGYSMSI
jgi:hypothetical protein